MKSIFFGLLALFLAFNVVSSQSAECEICQYVVQTAQGYIATQNATQVIAEIEFACKLLPSEWSATCDSYVSEYAPLVINMLNNNFTPSQICQSVKLCPAQTKQIRVAEKINPLFCPICENVVTNLEAYIEGNATQAQILAFLDKDCEILKTDTFVTACQTLINQYEPVIINIIETKETPSVLCSQIKVCNATENLPVLSGDVPCEMCMWVATTIEQYAENNQTLQVVETDLENICNKLPGSFSGICTSTVQTYAPVIFTMVEKFTPAQICVKVDLCQPSGSSYEELESSNSANSANSADSAGSNGSADSAGSNGSADSAGSNGSADSAGSLEPTVTCDICEFVYSFAEDILSNSGDDEEFLQKLESDCSILVYPAFVQGCQKFVETEGQSIINFIVANPTSQTGCLDLGFCQKESSTSGFSSGYSSSASSSGSGSGSGSSASSSGSSASSSAGSSGSGSGSGSSSASSSGSGSGSSGGSSTVTSAPPPDATGSMGLTTGQSTSSTTAGNSRVKIF